MTYSCGIRGVCMTGCSHFLFVGACSLITMMAVSYEKAFFFEKMSAIFQLRPDQKYSRSDELFHWDLWSLDPEVPGYSGLYASVIRWGSSPNSA